MKEEMNPAKLVLGLGLFLVFNSIFLAQINALNPIIFDVMNYGAIADGKTDNSKAFIAAWIDACHFRGKSIVLIPWGEYMLIEALFSGPCNGPTIVIIKGILKAPNNPSLFRPTWLTFQYVNQLTIKGGGVLDGQGASAWPYRQCNLNPPDKCIPLAASLRLDFVTDSQIHHIKSINSKNVHINLFACIGINISHVRLTAPGNSPNTDGIHIGISSNIKISHTAIATGDDCIAMITGTKDVDIYDVSCGPGHGISIGSLGKSPKDYVSGINVWNSSFYNTQNGARIKTWSPSFEGYVSNVTFAYIYMENVDNPIVIDQKYCPIPPCSPLLESKIEIEDVTFRDIWGTSNSKVAISLQCSKLVPCHGVKLEDINLVHRNPTETTTSLCSNVIGKSYGHQMPKGCL